MRARRGKRRIEYSYTSWVWISSLFRQKTQLYLFLDVWLLIRRYIFFRKIWDLCSPSISFFKLILASFKRRCTIGNPCSHIYSLNFLTDQVLKCKPGSSGRSWIRALIFSSYSRVYFLERPDFGLGFNPSSPSLLNRSIHLST